MGLTSGHPTAGTDAILASARLVTKVLRDEAAAADETASFPVGSLDALRQSGLLGLFVPERFGGLGGDLRTFVALAGELSGACLSTGMSWAMHNQQVAALVHAATPELQSRLLPRIAAGAVYIASVTSERGKGGHLLSAVQPVQPCAAGLRIERNAPTVTGIRVADGFLITMKSSPEAPTSSVSLVYVDRAQAEITITGGWNPMGMRGTESFGADIVAEIPADQVVGGSGEFRRIALHPFVTVGHIGWAACWLGAARSVFHQFVGMLRAPKHRKAYPVGNDLFGARLAEIRLLLDTASAFLGRVVDEVEELDRTGGDPEDPAFQLHVNGLKVVVSDLSFKAMNQLMEIAGLRHGYLRDSALALERVFRDMRAASLNYSNDRLLVANGWLTLLDRDVTLL